MVLEEDVGTSKMHEMGIRRPQAKNDSDAGQAAPPVPADENASFDVQQLVSQFECVTYFFSPLHPNFVNSYACFD
jgi:hypothetical protein